MSVRKVTTNSELHVYRTAKIRSEAKRANEDQHAYHSNTHWYVHRIHVTCFTRAHGCSLITRESYSMVAHRDSARE